MSSSNNNGAEPLNIAMYPWFALSHLTSFLRLANKLAEKGHRISFLLPEKTLLKFSPQNRHPDLIAFVPLAVPHVEGLPEGAETTNDVPPAALPLLAFAMDLTRPVVEAHLAGLRPEVVFLDFAHWLPGLARAHGAKSVYYATSSVARFAFIFPEGERNLDAEGSARAPPGFPCPGLGLRAHEGRAFAAVAGMGFGEGETLIGRLSSSLRSCDAIGSKTCRETEGKYADYLGERMGKPVLLAGPLIPDPPASKLHERLDGWLKGFGGGSVVYCALGSECTLKKEHFQELVLGLELSGRPFLAALKPPVGCETVESALPEGFSERTKGRGIVHGGWVQQPLILRHPSVGCFVTHCGAGSISEAILSECQLVLLPQATDQFINARFLAVDLRVGVEVEMGEDDEFCSREAFSKAVSTALDGESEVGREVRANHDKWREVLLKEGLEESYICEFIQSLKDLVRQGDEKKA